VKYSDNMTREEQLLLEIDTLKVELDYLRADYNDLKNENDGLRYKLSDLKKLLVRAIDDLPGEDDDEFEEY
jgi:predicted  nucleic acid-binding Zn-ribbon protein